MEGNRSRPRTVKEWKTNGTEMDTKGHLPEEAHHQTKIGEEPCRKNKQPLVYKKKDNPEHKKVPLSAGIRLVEPDNR